ncbi:RrF2 family transcriptional regulator [Candidatus Merdisoma sp. HCP28S3_D10]|uniref:RrF2 family transcriptional regulator n=1 Tax=unclassified Candidatus Merdisoma TaxID=3099611 RepID=UPI003F8AF98D
MQLSKKSRYGLRALLDLAAAPDNQYISLSSIAERGEIPAQFLEQVFASFRRAGLIKALKGPQGGYQLALDPRQITVAQVLKILEGSYQIADEELSPEKRCYAMSASIQELLISPVNETVERILNTLTLEDLKKDYLQRQNSVQDMYYI